MATILNPITRQRSCTHSWWQLLGLAAVLLAFMPVVHATQIGDANGDGAINVFDFRVIQQTFGVQGPGDVNSDGRANAFDFITVSTRYGQDDTTAQLPMQIPGTAADPTGTDDIGFSGHYSGIGIGTWPRVISKDSQNPTLLINIVSGFSTEQRVKVRVLRDGQAFGGNEYTTTPFTNNINGPLEIGNNAIWNGGSFTRYLLPGTYVFRVILDPDNAIAETNENNNVEELTIIVPE